MIQLGKKEMPSRAYVGQFNFKGADQQKKVGQLSGGERNRVHLAKMLKKGANVILLDEPTEGIQPNIIKDMAKILRHIRDEKGLTIFVSEQVLSFALDVADRIIVMEKGAIVYDASADKTDAAEVTGFLSV